MGFNYCDQVEAQVVVVVHDGDPSWTGKFEKVSK